MPESNSGASYSEPKYASSEKKASEYPWYRERIDKYLVPSTQGMLENYSGISPAQQSEHVHKIRDRAWAIRSYPCTGLGVWLDPWISHSPAYSNILERLKAGQTLIDIGCFLGGDLRRLAADGAPSDKMYGVDIVSHWEVGNDLFLDQGRFAAHFVLGDFLATDNPALNALEGKADIISISAVLHQWKWDQQVEGGKRLVKFSKPDAVVVGHQIGNVTPGDTALKGTVVSNYRHDPTTFAKMWDQIGSETGTKWRTSAYLRTWEEIGWDPADYVWMATGDCVLDFVVVRVQ